MRRYDWVFFDLDGTLSDPGIGITDSVMYALNRFGIQVPDRSALYKFIGPPLVDSFEEFYGFSRDQAMEATRYYREFFADKGIFENELFPDIPPLLERLRTAGLRLAIATSKPERFAVRIAEHFGIAGYFDFIGGAAMDETRNKKEQVIEYCIASLGVTDRSRVIMVGDRKHDIEGARACGMDCIAVTFGYGSREEFNEHGAAYIAESAQEVGDIILA